MKRKALTPVIAVALAVGVPLLATPLMGAQANGPVLLAADQERARDQIHVPEDSTPDRVMDRDRLDVDGTQDRDRVRDPELVDPDRDYDGTPDRDRIHQ